MNILIVDDERNSQLALQQVIEEYCPNAKIIGMASSITDAYSIIKKQKPDLLFLDIEMPGGTGFDLLEKFQTIPFEVIFVTGYDKYAINAIKFSCLDYILKPFAIQEIVDAVQKVKVANQEVGFEHKIDNLINNLNSSSLQSNKIGLPTQFGLEFVAVNSIIRLEANGPYTTIYLVKQKPILCTRILKDFEAMLEGYSSFIRVHRKYMINLDYIKKYHKGEGGYVVMMDGSDVDVSRRKKEEFLKRLNRI